MYLYVFFVFFLIQEIYENTCRYHWKSFNGFIVLFSKCLVKDNALIHTWVQKCIVCVCV